MKSAMSSSPFPPEPAKNGSMSPEESKAFDTQAPEPAPSFAGLDVSGLKSPFASLPAESAPRPFVPVNPFEKLDKQALGSKVAAAVQAMPKAESKKEEIKKEEVKKEAKLAERFAQQEKPLAAPVTAPSHIQPPSNVQTLLSHAQQISSAAPEPKAEPKPVVASPKAETLVKPVSTPVEIMPVEVTPVEVMPEPKSEAPAPAVETPAEAAPVTAKATAEGKEEKKDAKEEKPLKPWMQSMGTTVTPPPFNEKHGSRWSRLPATVRYSAVILGIIGLHAAFMYVVGQDNTLRSYRGEDSAAVAAAPVPEQQLPPVQDQVPVVNELAKTAPAAGAPAAQPSWPPADPVYVNTPKVAAVSDTPKQPVVSKPTVGLLDRASKAAQEQKAPPIPTPAAEARRAEVKYLDSKAPAKPAGTAVHEAAAAPVAPASVEPVTPRKLMVKSATPAESKPASADAKPASDNKLLEILNRR